MDEKPVLYRLPPGGGKSRALLDTLRDDEQKSAHIVVPDRRRLALFPRDRAITIGMLYKRILDAYAKAHHRSYRLLTPFSPMTDFALAKRVFRAYPGVHDSTVRRFLMLDAFRRANLVTPEAFLEANPAWQIYADAFSRYAEAKRDLHALDYRDLAIACEKILAAGFHTPVGHLYLDDVHDLAPADFAALAHLLPSIRAAAIDDRADLPDLFQDFCVVTGEPRRLDATVLAYARDGAPMPRTSTPHLKTMKISRAAFYRRDFSEHTLLTAENPLELVALAHVLEADFRTDFPTPPVWNDVVDLLGALLHDDGRFPEAARLLDVPKRDLMRAIKSGDAVDGLRTDPALAGYGRLAERLDAFRRGKWEKAIRLFDAELKAYLYTRSRLYRESLRENLALPAILAATFPDLRTADALAKLSQEPTPAGYGITLAKLRSVRGFAFDEVYALGDETFFRQALTRAKQSACMVTLDAR